MHVSMSIKMWCCQYLIECHHRTSKVPSPNLKFPKLHPIINQSSKPQNTPQQCAHNSPAHNASPQGHPANAPQSHLNVPSRKPPALATTKPPTTNPQRPKTAKATTPASAASRKSSESPSAAPSPSATASTSTRTKPPPKPLAAEEASVLAMTVS